ncbi:hypothetical protein ABT57_23910 [Photobacterium ganghwense]|uniref:Uncharacterized protein n=1 Tax=Photobacterium ganghwense TaxID=320778 RepID=A0A0J1GXC6_9GAMM|nr:hypothetical protein ABT57_23910 [Photobacterium ganghwense]
MDKKTPLFAGQSRDYSQQLNGFQIKAEYNIPLRCLSGIAAARFEAVQTASISILRKAKNRYRNDLTPHLSPTLFLYFVLTLADQASGKKIGLLLRPICREPFGFR